MPRSYRVFCIATFGWLILCGASQPRDSGVNSHTPATIDSTRSPAIDHLPKTASNSQSCDRPSEDRDASLCAAIRSAVAAEKQADRAWYSNLISSVIAPFSFLGILIATYALNQTNKSLRIAHKDRAAATSRAIVSAQETARALQHAETSAKAAADHVKIVAETQRPWVAIKVNINHFRKSQGAISISANVEFSNIGNILATNFWTACGVRIFQCNQNEMRSRIDHQWADWKSQRFVNSTALMPQEVDSVQANCVNYPIDVIDGMFIVNIMAVAYYKFGDGDNWHATERAINVALQLKPDLKLSDYITRKTPNQDFPPDQIRLRSAYAGETS